MNVGKNTVMVCGKDQRREQLNLSLKEVLSIWYMGAIVGKNGGARGDVSNRVNEGQAF